MTPTYGGKRYLAPIDPALGFSPGNVEFRFKGSPKVRAAAKKAKSARITTKAVAKPPRKQTKVSASEKRAIQEEAKLARRLKLASEFHLWNELRASSGK